MQILRFAESSEKPCHSERSAESHLNIFYSLNNLLAIQNYNSQIYFGIKRVNLINLANLINQMRLYQIIIMRETFGNFSKILRFPPPTDITLHI